MDFLLHIIVLFGSWLPSVLAYNLLFGKGKILHFGPLGTSIVVSYAMVITLKQTENFLLAGCIGLLFAMALSALFAWLSLRLDPDGLGVMSIAVHLALLAVILNWNGLTRGALGIPRVPRPPFLDSVFDFAVASVLLSAASIAVIWWIDHSRLGRQLEALAEHEWHARSLGINRTAVHFTVFLISGASSVLTNLLFLPYVTLLHPNDYQFSAFVFWIMLVVAGKPGSVFGVTLSTVTLITLKEAMRFVPLAPSVLGPVRLLLFGVILFFAVWYRRDSLFPKQRTI